MAQTSKTTGLPGRWATGRLRTIALAVGGIAVLAAVTAWTTPIGWGGTPHPHSRLRSITIAWPSAGQSAVAVHGIGQATSPGPSSSVPIASVAKVMTAYVVLRESPLSPSQSGFTLTFTPADVAQEQAERSEGQSTVAVAAGEELTEREALEALLLPSANNVAMAIANHLGGTVSGFVVTMNHEAERLGMHHTHYTDPSGLASTTVSTARDQLLLAQAAMRNPTFAEIVGMSQATIPVVGTIHNTDTLLGHDGFVGIKTGSDDAAGGCFMFENIRHIGSRQHVVFGVVLGQVGGPLIDAALSASKRLSDDVMGYWASG